MFQDILEYMKLGRDVRRAHLKLETSCVEIGGSSREFRGLLAYFLSTTIPAGKNHCMACHACNNPRCSNPLHLYWGSASDNHIDRVELGTYATINARCKEKFGDEYAEFRRKINSASGKIGGKASKGSTYIHKDGVTKRLKGDALQTALSGGWSLGR